MYNNYHASEPQLQLSDPPIKMSNTLQSSELSRSSTIQNGESLDLPITLEANTRTRNRSNSKVYGKSSSSPQPIPSTLPPTPPPPPPQDVLNLLSNIDRQQPHSQSSLPHSQPQIMISNTNGQVTSLSNGTKTSPTNNNIDLPNRDKIIFLVIATSLNETFDRKALTVPEFPNVLKLGRPNSSQKAPNATNGYFDSRVISREHAELYVKDGRVFIRDCNSSNGTFVNDEKLTTERELVMEDVVNLGVDIDNDKNKHQHHRKISLFIENVLTIPIEEGLDPTTLVNDVLKKNERNIKGKDDLLGSLDAVLFGDINNEIQDLAMGLDQDILTGIFVNNNIGTNSTLIQTVKTLITQIHMENLNNLKLASIENFLQNYKEQLTTNEHVTILSKVKKESELHKVKALEYQNEIKTLKKSFEAKDSQIIKTRAIISQKEIEIATLKEEVSSREKLVRDDRSKTSILILNYEEEIKSLKKEINEKNSAIDELKMFKEQYKQEKIRFDLNQDIYNMILVFLSIMAFGSIALWYR